MRALLLLATLAGCTVNVQSTMHADNGSTITVSGNTLATETAINPPSISSTVGRLLPVLVGAPTGP